MSVAYKNAGHFANSALKKARRAVTAGRAEWVFARPPLAAPPVVKRLPASEVRQPATTPVRHVRRGFGEGILRSLPAYRAPASFEDMAFWEEESRREEERDLERRFQEFQAMDRLSRGLDAY